jgi:predicted nucleic acid-binding protein
MSDCVIIDANIAIKCLHSGRGDLRARIGPGQHVQFFSPRFIFVKLFKHKERLALATKLSEHGVMEALYALVSRIEFVNESNIPIGTWVEAYRLCKEVDEKDTVYVALTFHLDGRFSTEDDALKRSLLTRGFDRFFEP